MPYMFRLQVRSLTTYPSALRCLLIACWVMAYFGVALAQNAEPSSGLQGQQTLVKQAVWMDDSGQVNFESARTQEFKPFNPLKRLDIGGQVIWMRLLIEQAEEVSDPLFLQLLPPQLGDVLLYSPVGPGQWRQQTLAPQDFISKTELGAAQQGDVFYLRLTSRHDSALIAFVEGKDALALHAIKLAVAMAVSTTLSLLFVFVMLWRIARQFSWMSVLVSALLLSSQIQLWLGMGYAVTILGLAVQLSMSLSTAVSIANMAFISGILCVFSTTLFHSQRWLQWLWTWPIFLMSLSLYAFIEPNAGNDLAMLTWRLGTLSILGSLLTTAFREPSSLRELSSKVALGVLLLSIAMIVTLSWTDGNLLFASSQALTTESLIQNIASRSIMLLVLFGLASWFYERLKSGQLHAVQNELQASQESLGLESMRLERQRKFTAMLAHELKNPLAVSHLALSAIKARVGQDDPLMQRSAAIEQSLQEIDAIIDRCSEMDGFEQGQLPMRIGAFTLNDLMAALKSVNTNERIYFLVRGIPSDTVLVSDIHYLKIIFSNLLTNALKYSPPDTLVELAVQAVQRDGQPTMVAFCVSNEVGEAGTPSPDLAFERFYRAESARNQSGAGLGLWLSQALAHALGSEVVMQINQEKISFTLVLPST